MQKKEINGKVYWCDERGNGWEQKRFTKKRPKNYQQS